MLSWLAASVFAIAGLTVVAFSAWLPADRRLGRSFWGLTLIVVALPLAPMPLVVVSPDSYGYGMAIASLWGVVFGSITAGWLTGLTIVQSVRSVRARAQV